MHFKIGEVEREVFTHVSEQASRMGIEAYAVGGYVRDMILDRPSKDIDITCVGDGIQLAESVASLLPDASPVNIFKSYGTAHFRYKEIDFEFVGARKESYQSTSRNPIVSSGTLQEDLARRDFTINALAISLHSGKFDQIIDLFNGLKHIEQKLLITPSEPEITFEDDPLRMMRAIRFATQLQYTIEPYTFAAIKEKAERIQIITQERITDELNKIMKSPLPSIGWDLLEQSGILALILPQVQDLKGVAFQEGRGHKDNFYHTLKVLDNVAELSNHLWLRWAALFHDIAKPATKAFEKGKGWTFHGHEFVGAKMVPGLFKKLRLPLGEEMRYVQKLVLLHLRPIVLSKNEITDSALRRLLFDAGDDLEDLMLLCHADITSKDQDKVKRYRENYLLVKEKIMEVEEKDNIRNWQPPISGEYIMDTFKLKPGKIVGDLKSAVREAILDGKIENNFEAALNFLHEEAKKMNL